MSTEIKVPYNLTFSSHARNSIHYPDTNNFVVKFPETIRDVVGISMQSMEMNLSQNLIREGVNDRLRFEEGLRLGSQDALSTQFKITLDGGVDGTVALPSYMNPIISVEQNGPPMTTMTITLHRALGLPDGTLTSMDGLPDFYICGMSLDSGFAATAFSTLIDTTGVTIGISGSGKKIVLYFDGDFAGPFDVDNDTNKVAGDYVKNMFVYCPPLSVEDVIVLLNRQTAANSDLTGVQFKQNAQNLKLEIQLTGSDACKVSVERTPGVDDPVPFALLSLGFQNGQAISAFNTTAYKRFPSFDAVIPAGNYDVGSMAQAVCQHMNRGAIIGFSDNGFSLKTTIVDYPSAVLVWKDETGKMDYLKVPVVSVYKNPFQLAAFLNASITLAAEVRFVVDESESTEHNLAGRFHISCIANRFISFVFGLRQLQAYYGIVASDCNIEASIHLIKILGFEQKIVPLASTVSSDNLVRWPCHVRTWEPVVVHDDIGTVATTNDDLTWYTYTRARMFPSNRYVITTDKTRPSQLTLFTTEDIYVSNTVASDMDGDPHSKLDLTGLSPYKIEWLLDYGELYTVVTSDDSNEKVVLSHYRFDNPGNSMYALSSSADDVDTPDKCTITPFVRGARFGIRHFGVQHAINYRMGIAREYGLAAVQNVDQQYDLRPNHYFFVVVNNINCAMPTNQMMITSENSTNPSTGEKQTYNVPILARCVVSAPFVFDRGQAHSLTLSQPVNVNRLHIELFDEDGRTRFQTNKQEISFTFTFLRRVRP